jgi:hypothetical protein
MRQPGMRASIWEGVNGADAARSLSTFPARSVDDSDFLAYAGISSNLSLFDTNVVY